MSEPQNKAPIAGQEWNNRFSTAFLAKVKVISCADGVVKFGFGKSIYTVSQKQFVDAFDLDLLNDGHESVRVLFRNQFSENDWESGTLAGYLYTSGHEPPLCRRNKRIGTVQMEGEIILGTWNGNRKVKEWKTLAPSSWSHFILRETL